MTVPPTDTRPEVRYDAVVETVPAFAVELWAARAPGRGVRDLAALRVCGRTVGERVEVDLGAVEHEVGSDIAEALLGYWLACRRFWRSFDAGEHAGNYVAVRRLLVRATQRNTKTIKADLEAELAALTSMPALGDYVEALTDNDPDWASLDELGRVLSAQRTAQGTDTTVTLALEGDLAWPACLGGAAHVGEIRRIIELDVSHAKWRSGPKRRLVRLAVSAEEIWPDPAHVAGIAVPALVAGAH